MLTERYVKEEEIKKINTEGDKNGNRPIRMER